MADKLNWNYIAKEINSAWKERKNCYLEKLSSSFLPVDNSTLNQYCGRNELNNKFIIIKDLNTACNRNQYYCGPNELKWQINYLHKPIHCNKKKIIIWIIIHSLCTVFLFLTFYFFCPWPLTLWPWHYLLWGVILLTIWFCDDLGFCWRTLQHKTPQATVIHNY